MDDAKENKSNVRWVLVVVLLMLGINGLLTRLLENIWVSLRDSKSPAYLPLPWWMAAPFTLFVFGVLSALLTSFSGGKNWLKMFCLLCGCKIVFTAVTAFFFSSRLYPDPVEAALQAGLLSLPSLLVHILLSGMVVLFLKEIFVGAIVREEPDYEFLPKLEAGTVVSSRPAGTAEDEIERRIPRPATVRVPKDTPPVSDAAQVLLPVAEILKSFPEEELAMSPSEIERATPVIPIPLEDILPQLSEGRVQLEAGAVISAIPPDAFARPRDEVAATFPDGMMDLPLREVVSRLPSSVLDLPEQERQPDVDAEYSDFFHELETPVATVGVKQPAPAVAARPATPRATMPAKPSLEVETPAKELSEQALVISEEERALLERSRDVITVNTDAVLSQFPPGAVIPAQSPPPDSLLIPLELIAPGLASGEVKLHVKYIFPQFPEGCLAISELEIARSLPNGQVRLPLREIVPQLPSHFLAPPEQSLQPELEEMPDPFPEEAPPVARQPQPIPAATPSCEPSDTSAPPTRAPAPSYADMLREPNSLELPIETVVRLLPEGAFRVSPALLKQYTGGETIRLPRSLVMGQLKEGRVVVPVEILTSQFAPEHLGMSTEQVKARLAEGSVEVPLRDVVGQVLEAISQPLERQQAQPECEEMLAPFEEPAPQEPAVAEVTALTGEEPTRGRPSDAAAAQPAASLIGSRTGLQPVKTPPPQRRDGVMPPVSPPASEPRRGTGGGATGFQPVSRRQDAHAASPLEPQDGRTILRRLLQKCKTLGISEHLTFSAGDSSAVVLAASSFHREVMASGMVGVMADMRRFCEEYRLGEPFKLLINSTEGVVVAAELVRGNPNRLIVLASRNRSGGGTMSLLLERFEPELRNVPSLVAQASPPASSRSSLSPTPGEWQSKRTPLQEDAFLKEASEKVVASLRDVGIERCVSAATAANDKLMVAWGEGFDGDRLLTNGVFDIGLLWQYSSRIGAGDVELAILVAQHAVATLTRLPIADCGLQNGEESEKSEIPNPESPIRAGARPAYLLCFFSPNLPEGRVRAKAARAAQSLLL